jgi:hypothetical protein
MHHSEHNGKYNEIKSDIEDAENLNKVLQYTPAQTSVIWK